MTSHNVLALPPNTVSVDFSVNALDETAGKFGSPEILNIDQGPQATSEEWIARLKAPGAAVMGAAKSSGSRIS